MTVRIVILKWYKSAKGYFSAAAQIIDTTMLHILSSSSSCLIKQNVHNIKGEDAVWTQFSTEIAAFVKFEKEKMNFHDHLQANCLNIGSKYLAIISVCVDGIRW